MRIVTFERRSRPAARGASPGPDSLGPASLGMGALEERQPGTRRLGALLTRGPDAGAVVVDLNRALAVRLALEDAGAPEAEADTRLPSEALRFLRRGESALDAARATLAYVARSLDRYDGPDWRGAGIVMAPEVVRLAAPVPRPGKILAVAHNYPRAGEPTAARGEPELFLKASSAVAGPGDEILLPAAARRVDYGGGLAAILGSPARRVDASQALACVAGYCVANDLGASEDEDPPGAGSLGRSCDTFAPLGPALVTLDELKDPGDLALRTRLSGREVQSARTGEMRLGVAELVAFASRLVTLEPGDVLLTGTPIGVGADATPPRWLRDGDVLEVEIEGLGRLASFVRAERR